MARILLTCADAAIRAELASQLECDGHSVQFAPCAFQSFDALKRHGYDLLILSHELSAAGDFISCARYRAVGGSTPVLVLCESDTPQARIAALDDGADDALAMPVHPLELRARVKALTRRGKPLSAAVVEAGDIKIDTLARRVFRNGDEVVLLSKEYRLLEFLIKNANQHFTPEAIMDRVWRSDTMQSTDTVRTHIKTLRQKLGASSDWSIVTRRGVGYSFKTTVSQYRSA